MILFDRLREEPTYLLRAVRDPALIGLGLNRLYYELARDGEYNRRGTAVFADEDWDDLVLLDACRYDAYADRSNRSPRSSRDDVDLEAAEQQLRDLGYGCDPRATPTAARGRRPSGPAGLNPRRSRGR